MILKERKIHTWIGDPTNCYIIFDEESKETMVIDPAGDVDEIVEMIHILNGNLKYIYLTHCHGDHIAGVTDLKNQCGGKVLIHRLDSEGLNDLIHLGELELKVLHTPGHTKGSTSLYCEKEGCVFSGDTMFRGTWGRTDLPTGSIENIMDSIANKLLTLPDNTIVYPGHGKATMIKEEKPIYLELKPKLY